MNRSICIFFFIVCYRDYYEQQQFQMDDTTVINFDKYPSFKVLEKKYNKAHAKGEKKNTGITEGQLATFLIAYSKENLSKQDFRARFGVPKSKITKNMMVDDKHFNDIFKLAKRTAVQE